MEKANYRAYADSKHARDIGGNPIKRILLRLMSLLVMFVGTWGAIFWIVYYDAEFHPALSTFLVLAGWVVLPIGLTYYTSLFIAALVNYSRCYKRAQKAVNDGSLRPTWYVRTPVCAGIIIVDETNRKIFINKYTYDFDDVTEIGGWYLRHWLFGAHWINITVKNDPTPVKSVKVGNENTFQQVRARLAHSLEFL